MSIKEQQQILYDSSTQRFKTDDMGNILDVFFLNEQNKQTQIQKFLNDMDLRGVCKRPAKNIGEESVEVDDSGNSSANSIYSFECEPGLFSCLNDIARD